MSEELVTITDKGLDAKEILGKIIKFNKKYNTDFIVEIMIAKLNAYLKEAREKKD